MKFINIETNLQLEDGVIYEIDTGCGCCGGSSPISKQEALDYIEASIKKLLELKVQVEKLEE